eukprot:m.29043 g.29043  ORF g.29043 m.29043 type:complete len:255 (+) comp31125_c0_seq6:147-911(+)
MEIRSPSAFQSDTHSEFDLPHPGIYIRSRRSFNLAHKARLFRPSGGGSSPPQFKSRISNRNNNCKHCLSPCKESSEKATEDDDGWTLCNKCESYRPPRAHHCRICRRCIRRMDHHCPWINNCVGELNQKYFILFLLYTGLACVYAMILTVVAMVKGFGYHRVQPAAIVCSVFLIVEAVIFLLFVVFIGCDQIQGIIEDMTQVEQAAKKSPHRQRKSKLALLTEVFGRGHCRYLCWLLPTKPNLSGLSSNRNSQA